MILVIALEPFLATLTTPSCRRGGGEEKGQVGGWEGVAGEEGRCGEGRCERKRRERAARKRVAAVGEGEE